MEAINLNNLTVDANGRASFSGLSSGIDLQGTVDAIIAARRIPVDRLEATVEDNAEKITSLQDLRVLLESMRTSLSRLYGQISFGGTNDIFEGKQAFAASSRVDGGTASAAGNLVGITVGNSAATGNHTVEILQTAKAHKISSDQQSSTTTALGFSDGDQFSITSNKFRTSFESMVTSAGTDVLGGTAGTLTFTDANGATIGTVNYLPTDTLNDFAAAITANVTDVTGTVENTASGVRLDITGIDELLISETGAGNVLSDWEIGVTKIGVNSSTTLLDLRDLINQANTGNNATGVNASVVTVTSSESYLVLTGADTGVTMTLANITGTPLEDVGILKGSIVAGNQLQYSEQADNAYWTAFDSTISADSILAPDGKSTADGLVGNTNNTLHYISTTSQEPIINGQAYIYSTYVKAGDKDDVRLQVNGTGFGGAENAFFRLSTQTVTGQSGGVSDANIEDVGNGWFRISMKVTASANGTSHFERYAQDPASSSFVGDDSTVNAYFWGAQLEPVTVETVPGPYVPTNPGIKNELQAAQNAQIYADGILDQTDLNYESDFQTSASVLVGSAGTLSFNGGAVGTVNYLATDTLTTLAANITANIAGVTATVVTEGAGVRLQINGSPAYTITETGGGTAVDDLGIDNARKVITRSSNTVDDLFTGVTLSLFAAEAGTTVSIDIEQDLSQVKTEILSFVESYNAMRQFVNSNRLFDQTTGELDEETGILAKSQALSTVASQLSQILGTGVFGVDANFTVLSQIGVNFVDITQEDPLAAENLEIDEALLDSVLLSDSDDVRRLFSFDLTSADPRITLLNFTGATQFNAAGYTLNIQPNSGSNLLLHSEEMDNAYWNTPNSSVSVDSFLAPDGTTTADGLVGDATNSLHYISTTTQEPVTNGKTYIYSTYVRANDRDDIRLQVNGPGFGGAENAFFKLSTQTVTGTSAGVTDTSIEDAGSGWYRISMKVTAVADASTHLERYVQDPASSSYTGDGVTVNAWFWGAQLEEVTTATTPGAYRPTTTTTVTAGTPTANIDGAAGGFDDGSVTVSGNVLTVNTGNAEGLQLFYNGLSGVTSTQLDLTVGLGAQMFFKLGELLDVTTGIVDGEIEELTDQNTLNNERITEMLDRLEIQRQNLLERYISMETAIASGNRIMDSLKQTTDQLANSNG